MAIYSRFGDPVIVVRMATVEDVKTFENRKPDKQDRERTKDGQRIICRYLKGSKGDELQGREFLADTAYLRADEGYREIMAAVRALPGYPRPEEAL
jgi:hypothetical protein